MPKRAEDSPSVDFEAVLERERETILARPGRGGEDVELFGVALSGGGIRSASFCLGALQALDQYGLIRRMDYLSTVSGGGYIGASMVAAMSASAGTDATGDEPEDEAGAEWSRAARDEAAGEAARAGAAAFPFTSGTNQDVRDSVAVGHIRDHSRFLAPRGFGDILLSAAILLRGLAVNVLLLLSVLVPLATVIIITNPTSAHLEHSIWVDIAQWFCPSWDRQYGERWFGQIVADPFVVTKAIAVLLATVLVAWALWRSFVESFPSELRDDTLEHTSRWTRTARYLLVALLVAFLAELQPRIVAALIHFLVVDGEKSSGISIKAAIASAMAVIAATATFRGTLIAWIQKALSSPTRGARLQAFFAQAAFYALGLALPLLIYGLFLLLVICGVKVIGKDGGGQYLFAPDFLVAQNWWMLYILSGSMAAFLILRWLFIRFIAGYTGPGKLGGGLRILWHRDAVKLIVFAIIPILAVLFMAALATRGEAQSWFGQNWWEIWFGPRDEVVVLVNYLVITAAIVALGVNFTENANGLHRLYRDRLSVAFRLGNPTTGRSLKLHQLGEGAPYLLVNGTLNVRRPQKTMTDIDMARQGGADERKTAADRATSRRGSTPSETVNEGLWTRSERGLKEATGRIRNWVSSPPSSRQAKPTERVVQVPLPPLPHPDPAKRGRNAEFFVFSKHYVGSDSTGYVDSQAFAKVEPQLDLAAAVAISGAAVSSSMGRTSIGWLGPTLALLNLRLGFWLWNPKSLREKDEPREPWEPVPLEPAQSSNSSWDDILRLYLFSEAFGRLRSDSSRIYITDGGHIDNIGLYQLLKRQCRLIIVIDAEADPGMNFGAFADVQRFARIDEGVLIFLDWWPVRTAALARSADRSKQVPRDSEAHKQHFAIGRIRYENGPEGILLYIKATVTGDEPDYVLDYERRYPNFPHEATSDQFFSEEQMEAYRVLGFHATRVALDEGADALQTPAQAKPARARKPSPAVKKGAAAAPLPEVTETADKPLSERDKLVRQMKERLGAEPSSAAKKPPPVRQQRAS